MQIYWYIKKMVVQGLAHQVKWAKNVMARYPSTVKSHRYLLLSETASHMLSRTKETHVFTQALLVNSLHGAISPT